MKLFGLVSGCVLFPACVSLGTAQGLDWQVTIYEGAAQEGASFVNQPGNLEECKRARLSLGATTPWYGDFKSSAYDRDQLFWQAGQATGLVGISVTLFEVDPVLSSAPPDLYPNRLGTMWSGALVWTNSRSLLLGIQTRTCLWSLTLQTLCSSTTRAFPTFSAQVWTATWVPCWGTAVSGQK